MTHVRIESMTAAEWKRVREIRLRALADTPDAFAILLADEEKEPPEHWQRRLASPLAVTFVAVEVAEDGRRRRDVGLVVGAGYEGAPDAAGLYAMWVDPSVRGLRIGRELVGAVCAWAKGLGRRRVLLDVADANAPAIRLYEACGFERTGVAGVLTAERSHVTEHQRARTLD